MRHGFWGVWALLLGGTGIAVAQEAARAPVLVELFTSEGCSSCPPADALLEKLDRMQPVPGAAIIVLSEHVDYWNSLGWKDPFSSRDFSSRQEDYARRFHLADIYTPEMVVDGNSEFVGNDSRQALSAIGAAARAEKVPVRVTRIPASTNSAANVRIEVDAGRRQGEVYLAVADNRANSQVLRGENRGWSLQHVAVVRRIQAIGKWNGREAFRKDIAVDGAETARLVAFVVGSDRVLGAAMVGSVR